MESYSIEDIESSVEKAEEKIGDEAENLVVDVQSVVVEGACVPDIPEIVVCKTSMRKKRTYPIPALDVYDFKAVELLLWEDHWRLYSIFYFDLDLAKYVYGVPDNRELTWFPKTKSLRLKEGRKSTFVALYYTNTQWCILEYTDLRKKERKAQRIFKYRE